VRVPDECAKFGERAALRDFGEKHFESGLLVVEQSLCNGFILSFWYDATFHSVPLSHGSSIDAVLPTR
jgi:hypothetical protein